MAGAGKGSTRSRQRRSALDTLGSLELAGVLAELLRRRPELRSEAEALARQRLADTDMEAVADAVESDLQSLSIDELNGRAGRQRWGYVEPTDAAWELLGEAVEPYDHEVERLVTLGMIEAATATALGVIAGLYRSRDCEDGDRLLSWAPDFPWEHASTVMDKLAKARIKLSREAVEEAAPTWVDSLVSSRPTRGW